MELRDVRDSAASFRATLERYSNCKHQAGFLKDVTVEVEFVYSFGAVISMPVSK
jgi:hypothetical protein